MTSSSLLRPTNQKQTICYCKSGECSAPKPEWCIGRRYADGFREFNAQSDAEPQRVTDEMVMASCDVLFERTSIAFGGAYMREALEAALNPKQVALYTVAPTLTQPDAEPVAWQLVPKKPTKEMIQAAYARQHDGTTVLYFKMWNAMLDAAPAPPRPDASAGLIEAAEIVDDWSRADRICLALGELTASEMRIAQAVVGQLAESIRRAADRSGK